MSTEMEERESERVGGGEHEEENEEEADNSEKGGRSRFPSD
jgi:hypothetical protein